MTMLKQELMIKSAPRMWRCFQGCAGWQSCDGVCSTHVEMFLASTTSEALRRCLLHACGDVSFTELMSTWLSLSAPRMWRCFYGRLGGGHHDCVCSTHVEMFLIRSLRRFNPQSLLHACGDVSASGCLLHNAGMSAPRMWRCYDILPDEITGSDVCSTHVEMFRSQPGTGPLHRCLLHACGDVSVWKKQIETVEESAPRMWRCFYSRISCRTCRFVCSTHVEMFLQERLSKEAKESLLHACGDVSIDG